MLWHLYIHKGTAYVPTVARTEAGFYMDIDPVAAIPASAFEILRRAITETMGKGNPIVPTPTRAAFPEPVVLKYAKVKSWPAFGKTSECFEIYEKGNVYQIQHAQETSSGGWEDNPAKTESFPSGVTLDQVAQRVIALIQRSGSVGH